MSYKQADADELRKLIEDSGCSYSQNSISYIFDCPHCGKKKKLYIRKRDGRFVCWYCREVDGYQGKPEFALRDLLGVPIRDIQARLYGGEISAMTPHFEVSVKDFFGDEDDLDEDAEGDGLVPTIYPPDFYPIDHPISKNGAKYLESRGIDLETAKAYDLYYWTTARRVVFPASSNGEIYGWQARAIDSRKWLNEDTGKVVTPPKAVGLKGFKRDRLLMFADRLRGVEHAVVCEGPIDAIKAHLCGGNVATMGKAVSLHQLGLLRGNGIRKLYLALDPDAANETARLCREMFDLELFLLTPAEGYKDLGEMSMEGVYQQFLNAERIIPGRLFVHVKTPKLYTVFP